MLKTLRLNKRKELKANELESLRAKQAEIKQKSEDLTKALDEAETEDDIALMEGEIDTVLSEESENERAIAAVEDEIGKLEEEIAGLEEKQERSKDGKAQTRNLGGNIVGEALVTREISLRVRNGYEKRERMKTILETKENRDFYQNVADIVRNRAVANTDLLIPEIVIDMINIDMQDVGKIYKLVTVRQIPGTARIIMSGDSPEAVWLDCCGDLSELDLDFSLLEVDCYAVGGFIAICNATLEDAFINLALHIQEQLTKAIAVALDKAIINGTGSTGKQLTGIIPSLPAANKVTSASDYKSVISKFALFPDDASNLTAVMTRATYYKHFAPQTLAITSAGQVVSQNTNGAKLPDGTPVEFIKKKILADDKMLIGDFSKYFLAQRAGMKLSKSEHVRFIQQQTVFAGVARYDGKPLKKEYWVLFSLTEPTTTP